MSTIVEDLTAAKALIEESGKALTAKTAELAAAQASVVALTAERDTLTAAVAKMTADHATALASATAALEAAKADATAKQTALDAATGELAKTKGLLRNPAFGAAALTESASVPAGTEGGQGQMTQAQALAKYRLLDGKPAEQKAFRVANWRVLGCDEEK
jgi:hypothetical protein